MRTLPLFLLTLAACSQAAQTPEKAHIEAPAQANSRSALLPRPAGPLLDAAGILAAEDKAILDKRLRAIHDRTGHPIIVVTVATLNGDTIEDYTLRLFNQWGVGGPQPGVVLLLAMSEKKVRIATGRGLEEKLPDEICGKVIRDSITPQLRKGDFVSGISEGVEALSGHLA